MQASESKDMLKSQKLISKITKMRQASNHNDKLFLLREIRQFIKLHNNKAEDEVNDLEHNEDSTEELLAGTQAHGEDSNRHAVPQKSLL